MGHSRREIKTRRAHRMKYTGAAILTMIMAPCMAADLPQLHSAWRETQYYGWCLEITGISQPLPGSADCVQVSGSLNNGGLLSGYACDNGSTINLFGGIESDNSIGPDIFIGTYN